MSPGFFVANALRGAVLLGLALVAMPFLRGASAATRRLVLALALGGVLLVPIVSSITPSWHVEAPASVLRGVVIVDPAPVDDPTPVVAAGDAPPVAVHREGARFDVARALACVWALGALLVLVRLGVGLVRTRAIVRRAAESAAWSRTMARAQASMGVRAAVRVTEELDAPAVTGLFAPVVLVPGGSEQWSEERRHAVLLHELAHVRQRDCLVHAMAQLACAVHWFDPLVWMAVRRLRVERELAADDAVLVAGARASAYAEDLLAIAGAGASRAAPSFALGMAERSQLVARVTAIVAAARARRPPSRFRAGILAGGVAVSVVAVAAAAPAEPAPSSLDPSLQAIADEELDRAMAEWHAQGGTVLALDPSTGEILANASRSARSSYVPGSTFKAITLAAALEEGALSPDERIDCARHDGGIYDGDSNGVLSIPEMLAVSSNIGIAKIYDRIGPDHFDRWLRAFHFDAPARIERGPAMGVGGAGTATPLQLAAAYATLANDGVYIAPTSTRRKGPVPRERVVRPETAHTVLSLLQRAVNHPRATSKLARIDGVPMAGKTGTSVWSLPDGTEAFYASFVGVVPADAPRAVILVGIEQARQGESGGKVAAPVFARVASRWLRGAR
ncbi:serine hydrolase [Pendulispora brunnea]|uniref:Serine hydrolase n=1 Tax=Pendulispora brunnea TaxID=2905690 RepID=A0ABZ2K1G7_9BACT